MGLKDLFAAHAEAGSAGVAGHEINVAGMHCGACERRLCDALEELGATNVTANHQTGKVTYDGELEEALIADAVRSVGFSVVRE